jgi:hypothetical protein
MKVEIHRLAARLMRQWRKLHTNADPYAFRDQLERVFHQALTRRIKGKRKGSPHITKAVGMWRRQLAQIRRGQRKAVNWLTIAKVCVPGFGSMSESERRREQEKLKNAVHNRNLRAANKDRRKAAERSKALAGPKTE